eukprot:gene12235-7825_t
MPDETASSRLRTLASHLRTDAGSAARAAHPRAGAIGGSLVAAKEAYAAKGNDALRERRLRNAQRVHGGAVGRGPRGGGQGNCPRR